VGETQTPSSKRKRKLDKKKANGISFGMGKKCGLKIESLPSWVARRKSLEPQGSFDAKFALV